jgi:hypothetical protein
MQARAWLLWISTVVSLTLLSGEAGAAEEKSAASRAAAAPAVSANTLTEEGIAAYGTRDYRHAVEKFLRAHAMEPDPNLLFNIARCYQALGDREAAMENYQMFLDSADADPSGRRRAEEALAALRRRPGGSGAASGAATARSGASAARAAPAAAAVDDGGKSRRVLPFVGVSLGIAAVAAGAVVYVLGMRDHDLVTGSPGYGKSGEVDVMTEAEARQFVDSGRNRKLVGGIAMGVGGAVLATSLAVLLIGPTRPPAGAPPREGRVAVRVSAGGTQAGILLQGRF